MNNYVPSLCAILLAAAALSTSGCAATYAGIYASSSSISQSPVAGGVYTEAQGPKAATSTRAEPTREGRATAKSILGLVGTGDASIRAAMEDGNISEIHHVDYETVNYLGLYAEFIVVVYGYGSAPTQSDAPSAPSNESAENEEVLEDDPSERTAPPKDRPGNGGEDTAWVQRTLNALGMDCGTPDGMMGPNTRGCIRSFQRANGLEVTGQVNEATYEMMLERL